MHSRAQAWYGRRIPLIDEVVVIDSDSADRTATAAAKAGATVYGARDIAPELGGYPGKGEALWKSLLVTEGDLLVFIDADHDLALMAAAARVAWQVLAGAMPGRAPGGEIHYKHDPFGVFYLAAWMASQ